MWEISGIYIQTMQFVFVIAFPCCHASCLVLLQSSFIIAQLCFTHGCEKWMSVKLAAVGAFQCLVNKTNIQYSSFSLSQLSKSFASETFTVYERLSFSLGSLHEFLQGAHTDAAQGKWRKIQGHSNISKTVAFLTITHRRLRQDAVCQLALL